MIRSKRSANRRVAGIGLSVAAACLLAGPAFAHDGQQWRLDGDMLKIKSSPDGFKNKFLFKTKSLNINTSSVVHDPRVEPTTLIVRSTGTSPVSTNVLVLDPSRWEPIGPEDSPKGWKFTGSPYYTDGITKIQIKLGGNDAPGSLQIQAKSNYWNFIVAAPQDSIEIVLTMGEFSFCSEFSAETQAAFKTNEAGSVSATAATPPEHCPSICGNGVTDDDEQCDDGNNDDNDTCTNACTGCDASEAEFASTYEGIQELIFDNPQYNCSNDACHGTAQEGGLDLRAGNSHAELVSVDSVADPEVVRVYPGDQDLSMLYLKIAEKTLGTVDAPQSGMPPLGGNAVSEDHLEALRLWIRGGAPETGVVDGTAELLGSCLPPPTPLDIPQPEVPAPTEGAQFAMPGYNLESESEIEGCVASYYDVSATVPEEMLVDCPGAFPGTNETGYRAGKCFSYNGNKLWQDGQSHHSIVHIYTGDYNWDHEGWGSWTCYNGPTPGAECDPGVAGECGEGGVCGSTFSPGVACLSPWGAPDFSAGLSPQFSGSQESTADFGAPAGVYSLLPLKGLIVWNSHAFNLTQEDTAMEAWINVLYTSDRMWRAQGLFDSRFIFTQNVPPFQQREYCATHQLPQGTRLFQLTSHTHKRGIRWRYYDAPQAACGGSGGFTDPACLPGDAEDKFYESYDYSDPVVMQFDPPKAFLSSVASERTIKFCALFDNGFTDPDHVKRRSTSPVPTNGLPVGGPCAASEAFCVGGVNKGLACNGSDANCPGSVCDACTLKGGVTTEDEMFIAIGTYYIQP